MVSGWSKLEAWKWRPYIIRTLNSMYIFKILSKQDMFCGLALVVEVFSVVKFPILNKANER